LQIPLDPVQLGLVTDCVLAPGALNKPGGYPREMRGGVRRRSHVWAWMDAFGPVPKGLNVCHSCDTPRCRNLAHLFLGTQAENIQDAMDKGRITHLTPSLLTVGQMAEIRRRYLTDRVTQRALAETFGVSQWHVHRIVTGKVRRFEASLRRRLVA